MLDRASVELAASISIGDRELAAALVHLRRQIAAAHLGLNVTFALFEGNGSGFIHI